MPLPLLMIAILLLGLALGWGLAVRQRKKAEPAPPPAEFRDMAIHLDTLFSAAVNTSIIAVDLNFRIHYYNPTAEKIFGYRPEEVIGRTVMEIHNQEGVDPERFEIGLNNVAEQGEHAYRVEQTEEEGDRVVESRVTAILDPDGRRTGYLLTSRDITREFRAKETLERELNALETRMGERSAALQASELRFRAIVEQALDAIVLLDPTTGRFVEFNEAAHANLGYDREEFRTLRIPDFEIIESQEEVKAHTETIRTTGSDRFETRHRTKDGRILDILVHARTVTMEGRDYIITIWRDITLEKQTKKMEKRAHQSRAALAGLLRAALEPSTLDELLHKALDQIFSIPWLAVQKKGAIFLRDGENGLRLTAQRGLPSAMLAGCARIDMGQCLCGQAAEERRIVFAGHVNRDHTIHYDAMEPHGHYCIPILSRGDALGTFTLYLPEGYAQSAEDEAFLTTLADTLAGVIQRKRVEEEVLRLNATLEQRVEEAVTENRKKDALLMQQSRLAAMGEMIGAIAHQWRQPINALNLLLTNLKDAYEHGEMDREMMDEQAERGWRIILGMSETIDDFRNFFQPGRRPERFDPEEALKEAIALVEPSFAHNQALLRYAPPETPLSAFGFKNELSQVALILMVNAKDAILARCEKNEGIVEIALEGGMTDYTLTVRDNGGGISEENVGRIFEPYFTTKAKGAGIGLYMAKLIVEERMAGRIDAANHGAGARFRVVMPSGETSPV